MNVDHYLGVKPKYIKKIQPISTTKMKKIGWKMLVIYLIQIKSNTDQGYKLSCIQVIMVQLHVRV